MVLITFLSALKIITPDWKMLRRHQTDLSFTDLPDKGGEGLVPVGVDLHHVGHLVEQDATSLVSDDVCSL